MKKLLSLILVLALCLSCGITALADEVPATDEVGAQHDIMPINMEDDDYATMPINLEPADPVEVTVTIAVEGELVIAREPVTAHDKDNDGVVSIDEALYFAHESYYEGGAEAGYGSYVGDYGVSMSKLWGDESGFFGYRVDDASAWSLADPVKNGQHIAAYVYADQVGWADAYSFFNFQSASTYTGELSVTLSALGYDADWNEVASPVAGAMLIINDFRTDYVTNETGDVIIKLDEPGIYVLSAYSEDTVLVPPTAVITVSSYPDSCGHWAEKEIEIVTAAGLFGGDEKGNFGVLENMTRADLVTVLYRLAGGPAVEGELSFADVKPDAYYANAVLWASQLGITTGTDDGFDPNGTITREQLVTFLHRFAKSQSMDTTAGENTNILSYDDAFDIDDYAKASMQWAIGAGLIEGYGSELLPNDEATRAEVAVVLARLLPNVPMPIGSSMAE